MTFAVAESFALDAWSVDEIWARNNSSLTKRYSISFIASRTEQIVKLDWHLIHESLQLPSHFEQIDPLKFLYAIQTGTSRIPSIQYMLSYLEIYDLYATGDIDENALIKAKNVDALFVKAFYIGIRRGSFGANYINSCLKALPHMEASVLPWHLTSSRHSQLNT